MTKLSLCRHLFHFLFAFKFQVRFCRNKNSEAICIHVGQAGVQIGNACWELLKTNSEVFASTFFLIFSFDHQNYYCGDQCKPSMISPFYFFKFLGSVSSTVSNLMARCPPTKPSVAVMTPSTPSSPRPVRASTFLAASSSIWTPPFEIS